MLLKANVVVGGPICAGVCYCVREGRGVMSVCASMCQCAPSEPVCASMFQHLLVCAHVYAESLAC